MKCVHNVENSCDTPPKQTRPLAELAQFSQFSHLSSASAFAAAAAVVIVLFAVHTPALAWAGQAGSL